MTLVAIKRQTDIIDQTGPDTRILSDDVLYMIGRPEQIAKALNQLEE